MIQVPIEKLKEYIRAYIHLQKLLEDGVDNWVWYTVCDESEVQKELDQYAIKD